VTNKTLENFLAEGKDDKKLIDAVFNEFTKQLASTFKNNSQIKAAFYRAIKDNPRGGKPTPDVAVTDLYWNEMEENAISGDTFLGPAVISVALKALDKALVKNKLNPMDYYNS